MTKSRWFRVVICLLMVCCLIFHMSPIKAEALALEASLAIGLVGALILASAGVVFVPETTNQIQSIGTSFSNFMTQWGVANNKQAEVQDWFFGIQFYDPGDDGDEDDDDWVSPTDRKVKLARGILAGISAWCASIILGNIQVEEEADPAPAGYMYYNGVQLPALPVHDASTYPYLCIWKSTDGSYTLAVSPFKVYVKSNGDLQAETAGKYMPHRISNGVWTQNATISRSPTGAAVTAAGEYTLIWSNYDIMKDGEVFMSGTEPASSYTTVVEPETYVGDIPQQIQDGELEIGGIELPDINYDPLIQPGVSLQDSTIGTLHKLSTGELSYENYLQQIKVEGGSVDPVDPNPPVTEPVPGDDILEPVPDMIPYAMDLTDYFPFCIPFDIYDFFSALIAEPEAPQFHWEFQDLSGNTYDIDIDLSCWDTFAAVFRTMQLLLFIVGLAVASRKFIKW